MTDEHSNQIEVTFNTSCSSIWGTYLCGSTYWVDASLAIDMLRAGFAVEKNPAPEPDPTENHPENEMLSENQAQYFVDYSEMKPLTTEKPKKGKSKR